MTQRHCPDSIINTVCIALELDTDKLKSKVRNTKYADGRFIISYLIRRFCYGVKYRQIAEILNRKQAVIFDQKKKCERLLKFDKQFKAKFDTVVKQLGCAC